MRLLNTLFRSAGAALTLAWVASGAALADSTGVSSNQIKIGVISSMTGPAASFGTSNLAGAILAFEEANAAGGVHGRSIAWSSEDDESSPPKGIAAFKKLTDSEKVFAIFGPSTSSIVAALVPSIKQSTVPVMISIASTPAASDTLIPNLFRVSTLNDRLQGAAIADYVTDTLKATRIAIVRQSDEYGKRGVESIQARLKGKSGLQITEEVFNVTDTDFTSQILRVRAADPEVLIVYAIHGPAAVVTRQARQLGVKAKILGSNASSSRSYPATVGNAAAGTQNIITLNELPESNEPKMAEFRAKFEKRFSEYARQGRPEGSDVLAYGGALTFLEGLKRAGPNLTREGFVKALESLKNFETGLTLPTTLSAQSHEGNKSARILEVQPDLSRKLLPIVIKTE